MKPNLNPFLLNPLLWSITCLSLYKLTRPRDVTFLEPWMLSWVPLHILPDGFSTSLFQDYGLGGPSLTSEVKWTPRSHTSQGGGRGWWASSCQGLSHRSNGVMSSPKKALWLIVNQGSKNVTPWIIFSFLICQMNAHPPIQLMFHTFLLKLLGFDFHMHIRSTFYAILISIEVGSL